MALKKVKDPKNKKGVAFILALFILVLVSILVVAFIDLVTSDLRITNNHLARLKAIYIADAGIEYAVSQLRVDRNWSVNSEETLFPAGSTSSYSVTYPKAGTLRTIFCQGNLNNNEFVATIEAKVSIQGSGSPYDIKIVNWKEI
ncbi:MAG: hypothetical protein DRP74_03165 [Candidatus Omnitrophota bacterium]|nr:MAG: hypothetical protein DRP74_03165 [Candidatus Omnitrophota bacterium]